MTPEVSHSNSYIDDNNQYHPFLVEDKIKELGGARSYQISSDVVG